MNPVSSANAANLLSQPVLTRRVQTRAAADFQTSDTPAEPPTISPAPIPDSDGASAAIQSLRQIFSAQPQVATLAQANPTPENALRLLP